MNSTGLKLVSSNSLLDGLKILLLGQQAIEFLGVIDLDFNEPSVFGIFVDGSDILRDSTINLVDYTKSQGTVRQKFRR